jgi:hypothetical protein
MYNKNPQKLEKNPSLNRLVILEFLTLFYYVFYVYDKYVKKLNIMSKTALGNDARKVNFSAKYAYASLTILLAPFVTIAIIFILDFVGFNPPFDFIFNAVSNTMFFSDTVFWAAALLWGASIAFFALYLLKLTRDIKREVIEIAIRYGKYEQVKPIATKSSLFGTGDDGKVYQLFNELVDEHNKHIAYRNYV